MVRIDTLGRRVDLVGIQGQPASPEEMERVLAKRRAAWQPPQAKHPRGLLRRYAKGAASAMRGAFLED